MKRTALAQILLLAVAFPCSAQDLMSNVEYRDYMKGLDTQAIQWKEQIDAIAVEKMRVNYTEGKQIADEQRIVSTNLKLLHEFIGLQLSHESLSSDIQIEDTLGDVSAMLDQLIDTLIDTVPTKEEGAYLTGSLSPVSKEIGRLDLRLRKHLAAFADLMEAKADRCSR
jgi:hypothetical protein